MKKWLFISLILALPAFAQTKNSEKANLLDLSRQSRIELVQMQDRLLEQILKIPFEKRAYIYPALFEEETMPKKVLTHPQIAIWKGKKPTRIAPQMQEYASKHLDTMAAKFYPVLDPDGWGTPQKESVWKDLQQMTPGLWSNNLPQMNN
ncbi:MAG: hypothetical protein J6Y85_03245 [Alphaproteobacteria bacterium]|nr:hypothetical protein [Alphaproteobacteria bacterium]